MIMTNKIFALLSIVLIACPYNVFADSKDIFITVIQPERSEVPHEALSQLENKMHQLITLNGIADTDPNGRFVITAKSFVVTKDIIGGAPQRISQKIDFVFIIGDIIENKVFESYTFSTIGIGINENKSYINAITKIKLNNPQFTAFIEKAKQKIQQYYAVRCEQIIKESKQDAANRDYQKAIYQLMQVPNVCDCSETCQTLMIEYYKAHTETTAAELLNSAKSKWASAPNAEGAAMAANIIEQIPVGTKVQPEVELLIAEINKKLRQDERRKWEFKMKQYNDNIAKQKREFQLRKQQQDADIAYRAKQQNADNAYREKQQEADIAYRERQQAEDNAYRRQEQANRDAQRRQMIDACREVGVAYAKNYRPPTYNVKNVYAW